MIVSLETRIPSRCALQAAHQLGRARRRGSRSRAGVVACADRGRVDAEGVLEVGADVGVGVVDGADVAVDARHARDPRGEAVSADDARRRGDDDVGAERQLRVDARLLVVGRGEDAEADAEREQQRRRRRGRG